MAECFENSNTVDVGYADAVSGVRQIKMLGLSGRYTQILMETQRSITTLNHIPGPWLDDIYVSKGASSVTQGTESFTGQINVELKKPNTGEKFYMEYFTNSHIKQELNLISAHKLSEHWYTIGMLHGAKIYKEVDDNKDDYLDIPKSDLFVATNRWHFKYDKIRGLFGAYIVYEDKFGGNKNYDVAIDRDINPLYNVTMKNRTINIYENIGIPLNFDKGMSIGLNGNFLYKETDSYFGRKWYNPKHKKGVFTSVLNTDLWNNKNTLATGVSIEYVAVDEAIKEYNKIDTLLKREEWISGVFAEYTYNDKEVWSFIIGGRLDYNAFYGWSFVPRMNIKYSPDTDITIRASAGRGLRTANVVYENISVLASSRELFFTGELEQEDAWNYGFALTKRFSLAQNRKILVNIDFYRTDFRNKVVAETGEFGKVIFYNDRETSFANSFQTDILLEPFKGFDMTLAYRYNDVKRTYEGELLEEYFSAKHKGLISMHYTTNYDRWKFTLTTQYHGRVKLPNTETISIEEYRRPSISPDYLVWHCQIRRKFKKWEIYGGIENIGNYTQNNPIIAKDEPFGKYFDSSMIYAPLVGRTFTLGLRYAIK